MNKFLVSLAGIALTVSAAGVQAGDVAAGKAKAGTCAGCHGANGISAIPMYPNLAGQKEQYLVTQLKAFKAGTRDNAIMKGMTAALSDADIDNLAAYFSSLK